jgi:hypothetical protein
MKSPPLPLRALLSALALLTLTACEMGPNRKAMAEEIKHSVPPMTAHDVFFDGTVVVDLQLGGDPDLAFGLKRAPDEFRHNNQMMSGIGNNVLGSDMGEHSFGGGQRGSGELMLGDEKSPSSGEMGTGRNTKGTYQGNRDMSPGGEIPAPRQLNHDFEMPPAMMRMRLDNRSAATVVVQVREVNSSLGNFAVHPDEVTLGPGQSLEVDPMTSLLGVDTFSLPVTVTLRAGGQTESKVITLVPIKPGPEKPPATPPPTH